MLWSFATLNVQPESGMIDALSSYMASECRGRNGFDEYSIAKIFKRQELTVNTTFPVKVDSHFTLFVAVAHAKLDKLFSSAFLPLTFRRILHGVAPY